MWPWVINIARSPYKTGKVYIEAIRRCRHRYLSHPDVSPIGVTEELQFDLLLLFAESVCRPDTSTQELPVVRRGMRSKCILLRPCDFFMGWLLKSYGLAAEMELSVLDIDGVLS
jgi:hypothetical protein